MKHVIYQNNSSQLFFQSTWLVPVCLRIPRGGFFIAVPGVGESSSIHSYGIDLEKIRRITEDENFLQAVKYFNSEVMGAPLTWEKVIDLFEIFRGG